MEDYKTPAQKAAQKAYMGKAMRVQLVMNPDNPGDAEIIAFLRSIDDGRPMASQVKGILHKYIVTETKKEEHIMVETRKRSTFCEDPFGGVAVMAEIAFTDNGEQAFAYGEWTSEGGDLWMTAAPESLFALNERILAGDGDPVELSNKRDKLAKAFQAEKQDRYCREYKQAIKQLLTNEMKAHGVRKRI